MANNRNNEMVPFTNGEGLEYLIQRLPEGTNIRCVENREWTFSPSISASISGFSASAQVSCSTSQEVTICIPKRIN